MIVRPTEFNLLEKKMISALPDETKANTKRDRKRRYERLKGEADWENVGGLEVVVEVILKFILCVISPPLPLCGEKRSLFRLFILE